MGRKKQLRIESITTRHNVFEAGFEIETKMAGNWNTNFFSNSNPIVLELGCGRGEYTIGLAEKNPNKNYIGVDMKGDRIAVGSKQALEKGLTNVAFLRTNILFLDQQFDTSEVSEIWITFPDPRTRLRDEKRRMTHERFLEMYKKICMQNGMLFLKTDNRPFFDFSLESIQKFGLKDIEHSFDLYNSPLLADAEGIKTRFEGIFTQKGFNINFLKCKF